MRLIPKDLARAIAPLATLVVFVAAGLAAGTAIADDAVKQYDSSKKEFWTHPPADWFLGDEPKPRRGWPLPMDPQRE